MKIKLKAKYFAKVKHAQFNNETEENAALEFSYFHYRENNCLDYYRPMISLSKMFNITAYRP